MTKGSDGAALGTDLHAADTFDERALVARIQEAVAHNRTWRAVQILACALSYATSLVRRECVSSKATHTKE
jgi:hypothetical protein